VQRGGGVPGILGGPACERRASTVEGSAGQCRTVGAAGTSRHKGIRWIVVHPLLRVSRFLNMVADGSVDAEIWFQGTNPRQRRWNGAAELNCSVLQVAMSVAAFVTYVPTRSRRIWLRSASKFRAVFKRRYLGSRNEFGSESKCFSM